MALCWSPSLHGSDLGVRVPQDVRMGLPRALGKLFLLAQLPKIPRCPGKCGLSHPGNASLGVQRMDLLGDRGSQGEGSFLRAFAPL